jgi:hypothetical protein
MNVIQQNMRDFRLPLFWDVTQHKFKVICDVLGLILAFEDGTDKLARNFVR